MKKTNFVRLVESEIEKAEIVLAVKDITDGLQKMASDLAKKAVDDVPAVVERIKASYGIKSGNDFDGLLTGIINELTQQILAKKAELDDKTLVLSGDAQAGDLGSNNQNDMEMDNGQDEFGGEDDGMGGAGDLDSELDDIDDSSAGKSPKDLFPDEPDEALPLGRKMKESKKYVNIKKLTESAKGLDSRTIMKFARRNIHTLTESQKILTMAARIEAKKRKLI